jgi:hypothetical protein
MSVEFDYHRTKQLVKESYLNKTVGTITQHLAEHGHNVLTFLPFNRQHCFSVANGITGPDRIGLVGQLNAEAQALLTLAEAELGGTSALKALLEKGVAVHTAAMLPEERRASEIAYERGTATVMFATGTMAQGLNLPATAVVIGGTKVGGGQQSNGPETFARRRAELLNAIGRAGRATVASRSMAILVPDQFEEIPTHLQTITSQPPFLNEEDASTEVESHLRGLLQRALDGSLDMQSLPSDEQTALTILSFRSEREASGAVLRRTWAGTHQTIAPRLQQAARALEIVSAGYLNARESPDWVATAAHRSGTNLPVAAGMHHLLEEMLSTCRPPESVADWCDLLVDVLRRLDDTSLALAVPPGPLESTQLAQIHATDPDLREAGWQSFRVTTQAWIAGEPLLEIAKHSEHRPPNGSLARTGNAPLPRTWRLVDTVFRHWMAMAAGGIGATITEGGAAEPGGTWDLNPQSQRTLALLPLGIRFGADAPSTIAWMRAGVRPRTVAHLLNELIPAPRAFDDDDLQYWAWHELQTLRQGGTSLGRNEAEQRLVEALAQV